MEEAVREFIAGVRRALNLSLSTPLDRAAWEASCQKQLRQLQLQLDRLLAAYPRLDPAAAGPDQVYDDTGGVAGAGHHEEVYEDTGVPGRPGGPAQQRRDTDLSQEDHYDDTLDAGTAIQEDHYDDTLAAGTVIVEGHYDDTLAAGTGAFEDIYEDTSDWNGGSTIEEYDEIIANYPEASGRASDDPFKRPELAASEKAGKTSEVSGQDSNLHRNKRKDFKNLLKQSNEDLLSVHSDVEAVSITSEESVGVEQVGAAVVQEAGRRWGRLQRRDDSLLFPYRAFWAALYNGRLFLYKRETDTVQKWSVNLAGYEARAPPEGADLSAKRRPVCFELVRPGCKTLQFLAQTPKDAKQWMAAVEKEAAAASQQVAQEELTRPPAAESTDVTAAATAAAAMAAKAAAAAAAMSAKQTSVLSADRAPGTVQDETYAEPDEDSIYADVSLPPGSVPQSRPPARVSMIEEDIYESIGSPQLPPEPDRPPPPLPASAARSGPTQRGRELPPALSTVSAPAASGRPRLPEPPPLPERLPPPPPPPVPSSEPPALPQRNAPPVPRTPLPAGRPDRPPATPPRNPTDAATEDVYDEINAPPPSVTVPRPAPGVPLLPMVPPTVPAPSPAPLPPAAKVDPFYNVLEAESQYLQPRSSPVPFKASPTAEETPDEGYGNSSGGSDEGRPEGHYKRLPLGRRPVLPSGRGRAAGPGRGRSAESAEKLTSPGGGGGAADARAASPAGGSSAGSVNSTSSSTSSSTSGGVSRPAPETPASAARPQRAAGGVADAIRRLNQRSGDDPDAATAAATAPSQAEPARVLRQVSGDLAKKQALVAGVLRPMSPPGRAPKPAVPPAKPTSALHGGRARLRPGQERTGGGPERPTQLESSPRPAGGPPVPNKSGVYKVLQRNSQSLEKQKLIPTTPEMEEEDLYAEIPDLPGPWRT